MQTTIDSTFNLVKAWVSRAFLRMQKAMFLVCFCQRHILTEYNGKTGTGWRSLIITVVQFVVSEAAGAKTGDMNTNIFNDKTDTSNDDTNTSYEDTNTNTTNNHSCAICCQTTSWCPS